MMGASPSRMAPLMTRRRVPPLFRHSAVLACVLALSTGSRALAQDAAEAPAEPSPSKLRIGAMLDVGAPDGVGISAVVRPVEWLRFNAGLTTNTLSFGVRGGVSLVPLSTFIAPSLNADFGHYFDTSYNDLVDKLGGIPLRSDVPVEDIGFNYAGASLGLEIGKPDSFHFYLRAGFASGKLTINDAERLLRDVTGDPDITSAPLTIRFTSPAIKLGFLLYFF
jgi:hypothetical protein